MARHVRSPRALLTALVAATLMGGGTAPSPALADEAQLRREVARLDGLGWIVTRGRTEAHIRLAAIDSARGDHASASRLLLTALRTGPQPLAIRLAAMEALAARGTAESRRLAAALAEDGRRFGDAADRLALDAAAARLGLTDAGPDPATEQAPRIRVIAVGDVDPALAGAMARAVARQLGADVEVVQRDEPAGIETRLSGWKRQWSADALIAALAPERAGEDTAILGLTARDLYAPGLNFVWASAGDGISVISTARLRDADEALTQARLAKQALTSLLDQLGAPRATHPACVNANALDLAEFDAKSETVCAETRLGLRAAAARRKPRG